MSLQEWELSGKGNERVGGIILAILFAFVLAACSAQPTPVPSDVEMIHSAVSAAHDSLSRDAATITLNSKGQVEVVRQGTNGWSCLFDWPTSGASLCVDKNGLEWLQAWVTHKIPPTRKIGFGFTVTGGLGHCGTALFLDGPSKDHDRMHGGPHILVFGFRISRNPYPATNDSPTTSCVMWPHTPYAHLMIPFE